MNSEFKIHTKKSYEEFLVYLKTYEDLKYKDFQSKLMPDYNINKILGIRLPILRKIAKQIHKESYVDFLNICGDYYFEEIMLKGFVIGLIKTNNYNVFLKLIQLHIPKICNWSLCDSFCSSLKESNKYKKELIEDIKKFVKSKNVWEIRVAIVLLLNYFLDEEYLATSLEIADSVENNYYYVSMARAWLVATAFSKNEQVTFRFFENCNFDDITFNRTIQKARESFRVSCDTKTKLLKLKRTLDKKI